MTDHANELRRYSRKIGHPAGDVPSVMLAAADEIERLAARLEAAEKERDFAKTEIARLHDDIRELTDVRVLDEEDRDRIVAWLQGTATKPAPSVPDATWLPVPDKHPTFDPVDLQLADGSVLCGCVPQSDGDYWWEGPSGEVFIDPRYAPVTHWRLSAAPEANRAP